jgi:hypothetical protein
MPGGVEMRIGRPLLFLVLVGLCAVAAQADGIDPKIILRGGGGSTVVSDLSFTGTFDAAHSSLDFINESGQSFDSLALEFTATVGELGAFSCEATEVSDPYFTNCFASGNTIRFFGENGTKTGIPSCQPGVEQVCDGTFSDFFLSIDPALTGTESATFTGTANTPEPASAVLLVTGLAGLAGLGWRRKLSMAD